MRLLLVLLATAACLSACDRYAAEVGRRDGAQENWDIWGDFGSLDECREAAIAQYNSQNAQSAGRAFSWACLVKGSDGGYERRER
jgi:hypothetical protein